MGCSDPMSILETGPSRAHMKMEKTWERPAHKSGMPLNRCVFLSLVSPQLVIALVKFGRLLLSLVLFLHVHPLSHTKRWIVLL